MTDAGALSSAWAGVLERVADRAAHEVRNVLNGVAVNVEVVRSRVDRDNVGTAALKPFIEAASAQSELVVSRVEALLSLARKPRAPLDARAACDQLASLMAPAVANGLEIRGDSSAPSPASSDAFAARLGIAELLLAVCEAGGGVVQVVSGETSVSITGRPATTMALDAGVMAALAAGGVRLDAQGDTITVTVGAAGARRHTPDAS